MIYLKNLNGQVAEYKDRDTKMVDSLIGSGGWVRVQDRKDMSPYSAPKKAAKKAKKKCAKIH